MSRSDYSYDCDFDDWQHIMWRGAVESAIRGKRGQAFLKELAAALDAMPVKRLVADELETTEHIPCSHWGLFETESVCALGVVGKARGIDMKTIDPDDSDTVSDTFNIASAMVREIAYINDECGSYWIGSEKPEARWHRVRNWVEEQIKLGEVRATRKLKDVSKSATK